MTILGFLTAALVATSVATSVSSAVGQRKAANYATGQGARQANDARVRGEEAVTDYRTDLAQVLGRQRAVTAASGIDLTTGSPADITRDTERIGELDVARIRENARREAVGLRAQSEMTARGLRAGATASLARAGGTLLTAGIDPWGDYTERRGMALTQQARAAAPSTRAALTRMRGTVTNPYATVGR